MTIQLGPLEQALVALVSQTKKDLAYVVKLQRISMDYTQTELAVRAGIDQARICKFENQSTVNLDVAIRTAHGLGVPLSKLFAAAEDRMTTMDVRCIQGLLRQRRLL